MFASIRLLLHLFFMLLSAFFMLLFILCKLNIDNKNTISRARPK